MSQQNFDDLTKIKGIGDSTQQWLRDKFGVRQHSDLAKLDMDELEAALKVDGRIISQKSIEQWVIEAKQLASEESTENETFAQIIENKQQSSSWITVATFVVVFERDTKQSGKYQTKVHHIEADTTHSWNKIEKHELGDWLIQQMDDEINKLVDTREDEATKLDYELLSTTKASRKLENYITKADTLAQRKTSYIKVQDQIPNQDENDTQAPSDRSKLKRYIAKANALSH